MKRNTLLATAVCTALATWGGSALAASISLQATPTSVNVGDTVSVKINMDFSDGESVGGGLDVTYDNTKLQYQSYSANTAISDTAFQRGPTENGNKLEGITAGGAGVGGSKSLTGTGTIGTLTFKATAAGTATISVSENAGDAGGFYDTSGNKITPTLSGTSVTITQPTSNLCKGDMDGDYDVDVIDLNIFRADFGKGATECASGCKGDIDHDNDVDVVDLNLFRADFGKGPTQCQGT